MIRVALALVHYPVLNKNGAVIGSAVTNLDIHDIARAVRTFGVDRYYVTTPFTEQRALVSEIIEHWQTGHGATYNPARKEALSRLNIAESLPEAVSELSELYGSRPLVVATSARVQQETISYLQLRSTIATGQPVLLVFGTAHGLAEEALQQTDAVLPPVKGAGNYNHLSVRSAAAIILDRLLGL